MAGLEELRRILRRIDGRGYRAYKDISGRYEDAELTLCIDYVQGDPFASPSKVRVRVPADRAALPPELFASRIRKIAFEDFLSRRVADAIYRVSQGHRGSGKSGLVAIDAGGQEVLERCAVVITPDWVEARLSIGLPAAGRSVLGREAEELLCRELPQLAEMSLCFQHMPERQAWHFVECVENQDAIRAQLLERGLVAFIANASILPRASGASDRPLTRAAVPFQSPPSLEVSFDLLNPQAQGLSSVSGMGIPQGVTLIVGGGYHGKSTVMRALERGVYAHVPGDGREYVVTRADAVKIRAEDGRAVEQVDISAFISDLPYGRKTSAFSTDEASGSTSQAANIVEALEAGSRLLLLDEDTSATNFMVRDARMQALVSRENEPITPFIDRVRELYERLGVSTVLVMGGSGDYFDVADNVIMMKAFVPTEVTGEAKQIAAQQMTSRHSEARRPLNSIVQRIPLGSGFDPSRGRRDVKISAKALDSILFGENLIDLREVEQLVDISQTRAIGNAIYLLRERFLNGRHTVYQVLGLLEQLLDQEGLDRLGLFQRQGAHPGELARPRRYEIAAAINRFRGLKMRQAELELK